MSRLLLRTLMVLPAAGFLVAGGVQTAGAYAAGNSSGHTNGNANSNSNGNAHGNANSNSNADSNANNGPSTAAAAGNEGPTTTTTAASDQGPANGSAPGNSAAAPGHTGTAAPANDSAPGSNGNKGHIQIEGAPDCGPTPCGNDNDPHLDCTLTVQLFGYPSGTNYADLAIVGQAPSGNGSVLSDSFSFPGKDSPNGSLLDAERTYSITGSMLDAAGLTPQANQGYHLRVEVAVDGHHAKTHVVWLQPCSSAPLPGSGGNGSSAGGTPPGNGGTPSGDAPATGSGALADAVSASPATPPSATPGLGSSALTGATPRASGGLAFTGANPALALAAAAASLLLGLGLLALSRRRKSVRA